MADDPIIAVAKVLPKAAVQLPPEVRQRLRAGTRLIAATAEDAVSANTNSDHKKILKKFYKYVRHGNADKTYHSPAVKPTCQILCLATNSFALFSFW